MTLLQKLKVKMFGKERWRVVGCHCPVMTGDIVYYHKAGYSLEITDDEMARSVNRQSHSFNRCAVYRKVK